MLMFVVAFATSALVCNLIVRSASWHLPFTADEPGIQPQKFHTTRVPRVGGLGLLVGMVVAGFFLGLPVFETGIYWLLILSLLPAFIGGFAEDVTRRVGAGTRLLLTVITAAFAFTLMEVRFVNSDMVWLNSLLSVLPFGYMALLFAVAGVAHSMNLIDGYHGLSAGVGSIILAAMGFVALQTNDPLVAAICFITAAATVGFLLLNWPSGRLFLGDGGAYVLGCTIALAGAMLIQRNPEISPWFPLALVIYPVWETLFSMLRRVLIYGTKIGEPDAKHMHSLVYRRVARRWVQRKDEPGRDLRNAVTSLPFWGTCLLVSAFAMTWAHETRALQAFAVIFIVLYCVIYWRMARLAGPVRRKVTEGLKTGLVIPEAREQE
jgi:UDP-GlcNAc:undecaprenyl-phosphate/decaprenyl-phosphate GlcNAc-1-phosphate transferase